MTDEDWRCGVAWGLESGAHRCAIRFEPDEPEPDHTHICACGQPLRRCDFEEAHRNSDLPA